MINNDEERNKSHLRKPSSWLGSAFRWLRILFEKKMRGTDRMPKGYGW